MTDRQRAVLDRMTEAMRVQFERNEFREAMPFPPADDLLHRAIRKIEECRANLKIAELDNHAARKAVEHAADAMNLIGLAACFGEGGEARAR